MEDLMRGHRSFVIYGVVGLLLLTFTRGGTAQAPAAASASSKTWLQNRAAIEQYLATADVGKLEQIGVGVTNPWRADFPPGGLVARMAWKPVKPGLYHGYWESYKSEIAAYEIDKILGLDMVPPTVEKRIKGDLGAAVLWVAPSKSFKELGGVPTPPPAHAAKFSRDMLKAKMYDNLIANKDPNLGNWLVDPEWNLILIDHTRSLTTSRDMYHELQRVDADLWDKMKALTEESLTASLGNWLGKNEIRAIIQRRDKMRELVDKLVAKHGEAAVYIR
jgi:hypothetical protein